MVKNTLGCKEEWVARGARTFGPKLKVGWKHLDNFKLATHEALPGLALTSAWRAA